MTSRIHKIIAAGSIVALAALALCVAPAEASVKKTKAKAAAAQSAPKDEAEPDVSGSTSTEFKCELGNSVTVYQNDGDREHIGLRWKKRLHQLTRVGTTTGAARFENTNYGLVWIGIPTKSMLLDSRQGRQLANECMTAEQQAAPVNTGTQ